MKEEIKNHKRLWVFCLSLAIAIIAIYKVVDSVWNIVGFVSGFLKVISPFLAGVLISYLLYIPEKKIEKSLEKSKKRFIRKKRRVLGILLTYVMVILILIILINVILPVVIQSANELIANFQDYYSKFMNMYNDLPEDGLLKSDIVKTGLNELQRIDFKQYVSLSNLSNYLKGAMSFASGIFDVFIAFVVSIYILAERTEITNFFKKLFGVTLKKNTYLYLGKYFANSNDVFFRFISSQFIDAIVVGILTTIAMWIMGVRYALLLGFTIGLFNMIPYFGAIIAVGLSALLTLVTGGFSQALIMLIVVVIIQQVDANIINPKIIGNSLKISPILVILSVTIGGAYFGIVGMFLGVPVVAVLKILVNDYIDSRLKKRYINN